MFGLSTLVSLGRYCQFNPLEMGLTGSILCFSFQHVSSCSYCQINPIQMGLIGSIPCLVFQKMFPTTITTRLTHFNWDLLICTFLFPAADAASLIQMKLNFLLPSCTWFHNIPLSTGIYCQINPLEMGQIVSFLCLVLRHFFFQHKPLID